MTDTSIMVMPRLKALYKSQIKSDLKDKLKLNNINAVPRLEKIVLNVGVGKARDDKKHLEQAINTLTKITGQKPIAVKAKKSIAGFKIRAGQQYIGVKVTLRGHMMYEFMERLIDISLPRVRDFRGVSNKSFDKSGNYSLGIVEQSIFPELTYEDTATLHGLQITFVIDSVNKESSKALLESFGMPFAKDKR